MLPFVFVFVLLFAIFQKTKILGDGKKQLDAIVAAVLSLIFVSFASPKVIVSNLVLVLSLTLVLIFVGLLLWGFLVGGEAKVTIQDKWLKWVIAVVIVVFVIFAFLWAAGVRSDVLGSRIGGFLFKQSWSSAFWSNLFFIVVIAIVLAIVLKSGGGSGK
jgi:hypothetical protein